MQTVAQTVVAQQVAELQPQFDLSNAALVALRPGADEILAMVGSADFDDAAIDGQVNVAISPRQPGSAIKPMLYATAFERQPAQPGQRALGCAGDLHRRRRHYTPANYDRPSTAR